MKRERQRREPKQETEAVIPEMKRQTMELHCGVTGANRKTLVTLIATRTGEKPAYLRMPSQEYMIGTYMVSKEGTLTGPQDAELIEVPAVKGFTAK